MRKTVIGLAMASAAIASPALARDDAWYIELDGGISIAENADVTIGGAVGAANVDWDYGADFGGIVGYDFGQFRLEAEAAYKFNDDNGATVLGTQFEDEAIAINTNALSFMLNGLVDLGDDDGLQGFVGGGVGVARTKVKSDGILNDSDSGFAWQLLAGIRAPLTDNWDVGLKYRFFRHDDIDLLTDAGSDFNHDYRTHSLMGTISYNFGAAPPPPPMAPPPPPPPPPPPAAVCNTGPYIVFFDWDKADITAEASSILDSAIAAYADCDSVPIMLAGYTDRSGSESYNMGLAARRNTAVRSYLTARSIPDAAITSQAFGEANPRVPTADGVRELQNRRVEITYGPGSGM